MFEQSLVESTHRVGTQKPKTMLLSLGVQLLVVFVFAIFPLIFYNVIQPQQMMGFLSAPPPPPPPPPPPAPTPKIVVHRLVSEVTQSNQLVAPKAIPHGIDRVVESAPPPPMSVGPTTGASDVLNNMMSNIPKAAPPPPPPPPAAPLKIGGDVQKASCLNCPPPVYPEFARRAHVQGSVVLHAIIGVDGNVKELTVMSGNPILANEAKRAVATWHYQPLVLNGVPNEVDTTITVNFSLGG